jgi:CheY-like chemotaxis protein
VTVFISHSFDSQPEFENVIEWLDQVAVPYWKPTDIKSADSLREQLRNAIGRCSVCIFIATHKSVRSSWCGAELGAFWGAGIPVIVYLADSSLSKDMLPPIVQGDVWERKLSRVAARARELSTAVQNPGGAEPASPTARVASITVEQLEKLIAGAVSLVRADEAEHAGKENLGADLDSRALDAASHVLRAVDATSHLSVNSERKWQRKILWVDDNPGNNVHERKVFESLGFEFALAASTREALEILKHGKFGAIISDMGRSEGPREGYKLLDAVRSSDPATPFFIYAGSRAPEHIREAAARGAQGTTNVASQLIDMVTQSLPRAD